MFTFPSVAFGLFPVLLRQHMTGIEVFVSGLVALVATTGTLFARSIVGRRGPWRSAPIGMGLGMLGTALGTVSFATGLWGLLIPAGILLGIASGWA